MVTQEERRELASGKLPNPATIELSELLDLVDELYRARSLGNDARARVLEMYLSVPLIDPIPGIGVPRFPNLDAADRAQLDHAIEFAYDLSPVLALVGVDARQVFNQAGSAGIRELLDGLDPDGFAAVEEVQLNSQLDGLYLDLLDAFSNERLITGLGIFDPNLEESVFDFFDEPGVLAEFAAVRESTSLQLLTDAELEREPRSKLMFTYKFFQANPQFSAEEALNSEEYKLELGQLLGFLADIDVVESSTVTKKERELAKSRLLHDLDSDLVRTVGIITTTESWITGKIGVLDQLGEVNGVRRAEFQAYITDAGRDLGELGFDDENHLMFLSSKQNEYTARYQQSGSDLSFRDWAELNLTPIIHPEMIDEQDVELRGYDEEIDPVIDALLAGMPFVHSGPARETIKLMLDQRKTDLNEDHKSELIKQTWDRSARRQWLEAYISSDILSTHKNGELIIQAAKDAGLNLVDIFRGMLDIDPKESPEAISLDINSSRTDVQDSMLAAMAVLSPEVASAIVQPSTDLEIDLEVIAAFESVLNPMVNALRMGQVWARRIKDAYIQLVSPQAGGRDDLLDTAAGIASRNDFGEFAMQFAKDIIGREFDNGDVILQLINDKYNNNPFEFFELKGMRNDNIKTQGELNRLVNLPGVITLPDQVNLQVDQLIKEQADFLVDLEESVQPRVQFRLFNRISELASQAGMTLEDFIEGRDLTQELRDAAELELNTIFFDETLQDIVSVNNAGNILDFFEENDFGGQTIQEITESAQDMELNDPVPGETQDKADARERFGENKRIKAEDEEIAERARQDALKRARSLDTFEEDERMAALEREQRAFRLEVEDPFSRAFERQASKFLFGPRGRAVAQDIGPQAFAQFEALGSAQFGDVGVPEVDITQEGMAQGFVEETFGADFFVQAARRSRQARIPTPIIGVSRRQNQPKQRLGATGGR